MSTIRSLPGRARALVLALACTGALGPGLAHADGSSSSSSSGHDRDGDRSGASFLPAAPVDEDFDAGLPDAWRTSGRLRGGSPDRHVELRAGDTLQYSFRAVSSGPFSFSFNITFWDGHGSAWQLGADDFDISITPGSFLGRLGRGHDDGDDDLNHGGHHDLNHDQNHDRDHDRHKAYPGSLSLLSVHSTANALQAGQDYLLAIRLKTPARSSSGKAGGQGDRHHDDDDDDGGGGGGGHGRLRVGIDDFQVGHLPVVSSVPEAQGWALYAAGLLTIAWLGRRRRRSGSSSSSSSSSSSVSVSSVSPCSDVRHDAASEPGRR